MSFTFVLGHLGHAGVGEELRRELPVLLGHGGAQLRL